MRYRDGEFPRVKGARGCAPTLSIRLSRPEKRAVLLACLDPERGAANMSELCRAIILADPRIRAALRNAEKGLDRGRVAHSA